jgi:hypothetical protein
VLVLALHLSSTQASHDAGAMAAMSIDMDPSASPANTATSLGTREFCARIDQNGALDADEDAVDAVQFDVTAEGIPPETAIFAFSYTLEYDAAALTVQSHDANFLLVSAPGSSPSDVSQSLPDTSGMWIASVVDLMSAAVESGSGVLDRVVVGANAGATAGVYEIELHSAAHGDRTNTYHSPEVTFPGFVAIDALCPSVPPTSVPTPTMPSTPIPGAIVSGTVSDDLGNPLRAAVVAFNESGPGPSYTAVSGADGTFSVDVRPNRYTVFARASGHQTEYWSGGPELEVHIGDDITGIDFNLDRLPIIEGVIVDTGGNLIVGAQVGASEGSLCCSAFAFTGETGRYSMTLAFFGEFTLLASADGYLSEYWTAASGSRELAGADILSVLAPGQVIGGIDFVLLPQACAPADITGDTTVNVRDITAVARAMDSRPGDHRWNPAADVNDDGRVNYRDLALVLRAVRSRDCR